VVWLAERKIDLMIGRFTDDAQQAQFHYERLASEQLQVVAGVDHPLRGATDLGLAKLAHWPWVLYPPSTAVRKVSDDLFGSSGLALRSGVVETPSFLFALELMQATDMLSLQPAALVDRYVQKGLLARIAVELPDRMPDYGLITRLDEAPTPAALAFIAVLRAKAAGAAAHPAATAAG
jgi:DNA-binding transcriptional LysR family regulator